MDTACMPWDVLGTAIDIWMQNTSSPIWYLRSGFPRSGKGEDIQVDHVAAALPGLAGPIHSILCVLGVGHRYEISHSDNHRVITTSMGTTVGHNSKGGPAHFPVPFFSFFSFLFILWTGPVIYIPPPPDPCLSLSLFPLQIRTLLLSLL